MELNQKATAETEVSPAQKTHRPVTFLCLMLLALLLTLVIELFNHKAFTAGFSSFTEFVTGNPLALLVNFSLVLLSLAPAMFLRRRIFYSTIVSAVWMIGGAVNGFILLNRMTPFTVADLSIFQTGLDTIPNYLSTKYIVLMVVSLAALVVALVLLFLRGPRNGIEPRRRAVSGLLAVAFSAVLLAGGWHLAFSKAALSETFPNLAFAYEDYGFSYCFLQTWLNKGIHHPTNYTASSVDILRQDEVETTAQDDVNVIYVQLESYIDPADVKGLELSEEALPYWRELTENYSTGYLTVPVVGAGTANTECEVLTGMSTKLFGPGEYPYQTCLLHQTAESVAYNLKEHGYGTHAIHNHRAAFYHRNEVYANLGFDDFTALEYMPKVQKTPKNWAKDFILTKQILQALDSTENQSDLVFTVSVQGHGKYPQEPVLEDPEILVKACPDEDYHYAMEYYVNQIHEMDEFVRQLTAALSARDEKTVLVLYGDHLPALNLKPEDMGSGSLYNTTYVIWDNFGLEKQDMDLTAFQISSVVMERLGITSGEMNRYHQQCRTKPFYREGLHTLQYDVLYGKKYLYGGTSPYEPTDMQMGTVPIVIRSMFENHGEYYLSGENFTPFCKVFIDGEQVKTSYVSPSFLKLREEPETTDLTQYSIRVMDKHKEVLSEIEHPYQPEAGSASAS